MSEEDKNIIPEMGTESESQPQNMDSMQYQSQPQQNVYSEQYQSQPQQNVYSAQYQSQSQQNVYGTQYQNQPQQNVYGTQYQNQSQQNVYSTQYQNQPQQNYGTQYQNQYQQNTYGANYQNPPVYYNMNPNPAEKKDSQGFGIASLILGILSLLLFCTCINIPLAILAIIFGIIQLVKYKQKGLAIGGLVTAGISLLLLIILVAAFPSTSSNLYEDLYDDLYEEYDFTEMEIDEDYGLELL